MNDLNADLHSPAPVPSSSAPFDAWAVLDFWLRRWKWLAFWTLALGAAGAAVAQFVWGRTFTASSELIHYVPSDVDDAFRPRDIPTPSLVLMLQSPELLNQVGAQEHPAMTAELLARRLQLTLDRNNEVAEVTATGADREATVDLINRFSTAAIAYTQKLQRREANEADDYVRHQLAAVESEIASTRAANQKSGASAAGADDEAAEAPNPAIVSDLPQRIQTAREQLDDLLVRYTDAHPLVRTQRAELAALEDQQRRAAANAAAAAALNPPHAARTHAAAPGPSALYGRLSPEEVALGERLRSLETNRALLISRERAIQPFREDPPGYFRVLVPASADRTLEHRHRLEIVLYAALGAFLGIVGSAGQILMSEFLDNRVKTRGDVKRVTGLPLLATLGDLARLSPVGRSQWAFRTWTALQSRLSLSPNHGMICGITSAQPGDGRSTWVDLLGRAASSCGFRVLTITAQPSAEMAAEFESRKRRSRAAPMPPTPPPPAAAVDEVALTTSVLSTPSEIVARLASAESPPVVNIPLPGWVWNLERRKQWQSALEAWRAIEHVVIFVELPPASVPETVLLAENIPNLVWLVDSCKSDASETHIELQTLRDAKCNLVGAVLNRERTAPVRGRFTRWLGRSAFLFIAAFALATRPSSAAQADTAQTAVAVPDSADPESAGATATPAAFSVDGPQRQAWQQRLTLGPGDIVSFHLYGSPELTREEVPIGPDGRVSYLEAANVMAAGLTVDEFRDRMQEELGRFRRAPQPYVTPVAYHSKKYFMLGTVVQKGVFPLDRPLTIVEAVARARGFETGVSGGIVVETTDFAHSFLGRGGQHMPVDFERLFLHGDLSQNVALEPGDYLYFPAAGTGEIYVLGEVKQPGAVAYDMDTNALSAIAARGGFTERAWTGRVLVVRGSLNHPQTFKVDISGVIAGNASNVGLQPGDIVYVGSRPWIRAEELLDRAASAFVESAVVTWTGIHVGPNSGAAATSISP